MTIYTVVRKPTSLNSTVALGTADLVHREGVLSVYSFILVLDKPSDVFASTVVAPLIASSTVTVESVHTVSVSLPPKSYIDVELLMNGELLDSTTSGFEHVAPGATPEGEASGESVASESVVFNSTPESEAVGEATVSESVSTE